MKQFRILALTTLSILALVSTVFAIPPMNDDRMIQISGMGVYAEAGACNDDVGETPSYVLSLTGSLVGCHYVIVEASRCSPGGGYYESGREIFVGTFNGGSGRFTTNYIFTAKYQNCSTFVGETAGRCQHPFEDGSGTGVFTGMKEARFTMKDDVTAGNFPYTGHILF